MDQIQKTLLEEIAGLHEVPAGAYNIRANGKSVSRNVTANIDIVTKEDKQGIDIIIKPGTKKESVHIPVVLSQSGLKEMVYNDFFVGDDCDVTSWPVAAFIMAVMKRVSMTASTASHWQEFSRSLCGKALWQRRRKGKAYHES